MRRKCPVSQEAPHLPGSPPSPSSRPTQPYVAAQGEFVPRGLLYQNRCFVQGPGSLVRSKAAEALRLPSPVSGAGMPQVAGHRTARPTQPADLNSPSVPSPTCKANDKPRAPWAWRRSRCRCQLPTSWSRVPSVSSAGGGGGRRREKLRRPALQDRQSVGQKVSCVSPEMVP